ncbi:MAG: hypothetical protein ACYS0C_07645 [Planctomycetota bacterium]
METNEDRLENAEDGCEATQGDGSGWKIWKTAVFILVVLAVGALASHSLLTNNEAGKVCTGDKAAYEKAACELPKKTCDKEAICPMVKKTCEKKAACAEVKTTCEKAKQCEKEKQCSLSNQEIEASSSCPKKALSTQESK